MKADDISEVYFARDTLFNEDVVVKIVRDKELYDTELRILQKIENEQLDGFPKLRRIGLFNGCSCFVL